MGKKEDYSQASRPRVFPIIRELTADESRTLLGRHKVGRIAFSLNDRVDIQPIHYVFDDEWLYGRTSHGTKFATLARHSWCVSRWNSAGARAAGWSAARSEPAPEADCFLPLGPAGRRSRPVQPG